MDELNIKKTNIFETSESFLTCLFQMIRRFLQFVLAAVFILSGTNKVTDVAHADTHKFLSAEAPKWGKVRPMLSVLLRCHLTVIAGLEASVSEWTGQGIC
jgi:hypothetical protein